MSKETAMFNQIWLWLNDLDAEFEMFCYLNDLDQSNPMSLQVFKNSYDEVVKKEKMISSFFNLDGFFVCWGDGLYLFNQTRERAEEFFKTIQDERPEMFEFCQGKLKRIA